MPYDISYEYDAAGNRIRKVDNLTAAVTTYTYDAANQLATEQTAAGTTSYTFDRAGNMETITTPFSDVTTYIWDAENRRTAVQTSGGSVEAAYNADGLRLRNGDTRFLWDGQAYLSEANSVSGESTLYTVQPSRYGRLISEKRSAMTSEWFHFDALGSTVNVSDHNEFVPERYIYDAWGNLLSSNSFKPAFLYVGERGYLSEETGGAIDECYVRARYFVSNLARFLSVDPLGLDGHSRVYSYGTNNPLSHIDPSGLLSTLIVRADLNNGCGDVGILWEYRLSPVLLAAKGYFVQKLILTRAARKCSNVAEARIADFCRDFRLEQAFPEPLTFYEAFPFDGSRPVRDRSIDPGEGRGTCGMLNVEREIRFYPIEDWGQWKGVGQLVKKEGWNDKGNVSHVNTAGFTVTYNTAELTSLVQPTFWSNLPLDGPAVAVLDYHWCCCRNFVGSVGFATDSEGIVEWPPSRKLPFPRDEEMI